MSDGFDKEAEREKLREKLSDDEEKREHTQRMSELLLKGATMTNRHCDDCGDPIFRQDGREFCPTCHTVDAADAEEAAQATRTADEDQPVNATGSGATTADDAPATSRNVSAPDPEAAGAQGSEPSPAAERRPTGEPVGAGRPDADGDAARSDTATASARAPRRAPPENAGSIADARESLTRTLTRFARAAEHTDDPRRARDNLQAAREAAEALSALD